MPSKTKINEKREIMWDGLGVAGVVISSSAVVVIARLVVEAKLSMLPRFTHASHPLAQANRFHSAGLTYSSRLIHTYRPQSFYSLLFPVNSASSVRLLILKHSRQRIE